MCRVNINPLVKFNCSVTGKVILVNKNKILLVSSFPNGVSRIIFSKEVYRDVSADLDAVYELINSDL